MSLLKELYKLKEQDVTFKRGEMTAAPGDDAEVPPAGGELDAGAEDVGAGDDLGSDVPGDDLGSEDLGGEEGTDSISVDLPALIKALEWAHQEATDDEQLHKFVEELSASEHVDMDAVESAISSCCGDDGMGDDLGDDMGGEDLGDEVPSDDAPTGDEMGGEDLGDDLGGDDLGGQKLPSKTGL